MLVKDRERAAQLVRRIWAKTLNGVVLAFVALSLLLGATDLVATIGDGLLYLIDQTGFNVFAFRFQPPAKLPSTANARNLQIFERDAATLKLWRLGQYDGIWYAPTTTQSVTIDKEGYRVIPHVRGVSSASRRIVILGSSQAFGVKLLPGETLDAQLERVLPGSYVSNRAGTAVPARSDVENLVDLLSAGSPPDEVLILGGNTDQILFCDPRNPRGPVPYASETQIQRYRTTALMALVQPIVHLVQDLRTDWQTSTRIIKADVIPPGCASDGMLAESVAQQVVEAWRNAHAIASERGVRLDVIWLPSPYRGHPNIENVRDDWMFNYFEQTFTAVDSRLAKKVTALNADWIHNEANVFDGGPELYFDTGGHYSAAGARILAERIALMLRTSCRGIGPIAGPEAAGGSAASRQSCS